MTAESDWQSTVIETAHTFRWKAAHFRPARTVHGWRTPVAADGAGFPDLLLVRDRLIFAEIKSETGKLSDEQEAWLNRLRAAGAEAHVWRPDDWDEIVSTLRRRAPA